MAQGTQLDLSLAAFGDVPANRVRNPQLRQAAHAPLKPAHRAVGAHLAALKSDDVLTGGEFGEDRLHRLDVVGVDVVHERSGQQLLPGVPKAACMCHIDALQVPVESRDAERIMRKVEEPSNSSSND
jgi:hypothetical protein